MNDVSQRSDGCLALDGGQTCPFFSVIDAELADMISHQEKREWWCREKKQRVQLPRLRTLFQKQRKTNFEQIYYNGGGHGSTQSSYIEISSKTKQMTA